MKKLFIIVALSLIGLASAFANSDKYLDSLAKVENYYKAKYPKGSYALEAAMRKLGRISSSDKSEAEKIKALKLMLPKEDIIISNKLTWDVKGIDIVWKANSEVVESFSTSDISSNMIGVDSIGSISNKNLNRKTKTKSQTRSKNQTSSRNTNFHARGEIKGGILWGLIPNGRVDVSGGGGIDFTKSKTSSDMTSLSDVGVSQSDVENVRSLTNVQKDKLESISKKIRNSSTAYTNIYLSFTVEFHNNTNDALYFMPQKVPVEFGEYTINASVDGHSGAIILHKGATSITFKAELNNTGSLGLINYMQNNGLPKIALEKSQLDIKDKLGNNLVRQFSENMANSAKLIYSTNGKSVTFYIRPEIDGERVFLSDVINEINKKTSLNKRYTSSMFTVSDSGEIENVWGISVKPSKDSKWIFSILINNAILTNIKDQTLYPNDIIEIVANNEEYYKATEYENLQYLEVIKKYADAGNSLGQFLLGKYYTNTNVTKAVEWYSKSAEQGHADAQFALGICYHEGIGVVKDYKKAVEWYSKSAEQGHADAQFALGLFYMNGDGVVKDLTKAVEWIEKSVEQGHAGAQYSLGRCYYYGYGVETDYKKAVEWYSKSAEQGVADAQFALGLFYMNGDGVVKDLTKAVEWIEKSVEQGHAGAQYSLGRCYYYGYGVETDYKKAVEWYSKSAEQGHADAQFALGIFYMNGYGVETDYKKAVEWFEKSAEQGHADAQLDLGICYREGVGVPRDLNKSKAWFEKAAAQGNQAVIKFLKENF